MKESELAVQTVARFAAENHDGFLEELKDLIRIPSISSSTEHKGDVERCAQFTKKIMLEIGLEKAEIWETDGHPIVYGEWLVFPESQPFSYMVITMFSQSTLSISGRRRLLNLLSETARCTGADRSMIKVRFTFI